MSCFEETYDIESPIIALESGNDGKRLADSGLGPHFALPR